ncbi:major facilitator superfamily domain-containing protein [Amylocarpus encephaloides]|uniref:Major facilitator superfamily domain-containing protein n=1 Tax=Amylocarpus encephaloides TaxID=45428 RepID=A0A9P7YUV9_9HELO|nr:major facilitator superfamily domain-containing protein [Amylocarpus encephaloides]
MVNCHKDGGSGNGDGHSNYGGIDLCEICENKRKAMRKYRFKIVLGLCLPYVVQSLDTTIIAGALSTIASEFNELSQLNWIVSAYTLTAASFIPFWGQFADVFGRYAAIQWALVFMIFGSVLCSAAPTTSFVMFLLGRAFQGMGCAGCLIVTKVVLADKVTLKENAENNTLFTIVAAVGYGIGPVIGGYLTEVSWRWCFIINIPIGVMALVLVHVITRPELVGAQAVTRNDDVEDPNLSQGFIARVLTLDFGGQLLFILGLGLLILSLTWAGSDYPWSDVRVISTLVVACILIALFLVWEYFLTPGKFLACRFPTQRAMIALNLVFSRNGAIMMYLNFILGMCMYAVFYFVGVYFVIVQGFSSGKSGTSLIYYLPGLGGGAFLANYFCNKRIRQTFWPLFTGTIIEPLGITLLAVGMRNGNLPLVYGMLVLTGVGSGIRFMPGTLHAVGYFPQSVATIVSLMSLSLSLGGAISTTLLMNIFNNTIRTSANSIDVHSVSSTSFSVIEALPEEEQHAFKNDAKQGIFLGFLAVSAFAWLGCVAVMGLGNIKISIGPESESENMREGRNENGDVIVKGSYVMSLLRPRKGIEVRPEDRA